MLTRDIWAFTPPHWQGAPHGAHSYTQEAAIRGQKQLLLLPWTERRLGLEGASANSTLLQQFISPGSLWGRDGKMSSPS